MEQVNVGHLDEVHRKLITVVNDRNATRNPAFPLTKVWIGGWENAETTHKKTCNATLNFLEMVADNIWLRLPAPETEMEGRGWKFVRSEDTRQGESMDVDKFGDTQESMVNGAVEQNDDEFEEPEDAKMIFLPPRGRRNNGSGGSSMCKNILCNRSMAAMKMGDPDSMSFKFTATKLWYGQQVSEGRDFKHIMVDTWQNVFKELRITIPR
ncbi:hypothetical protein ACO1O0_002481 [Amphichorda felina]